jgi:hypothetical protein
MTPSIYLNLEDDVARIVARIKKEKADKLVLVCPKRCFLFNDSINLRLLKKQVDLLKKEVYILTMDERGQIYAKEAGFQLRFLPKSQKSHTFSDIAIREEKVQAAAEPEPEQPSPLVSKVKEMASIAKLWGRHDEEETKKVVKNPAASPLKNSKPEPHAAKLASPKVSVNDAIFPKGIENVHRIKRKKAYNQKVITGLVAVSLIVILAVVFVVLPKATVVVYPKSEPVTRDVEVSISTGVKLTDSSRLVMPATKVEETLESSDQFDSQGKKEVGNKASGSVQIYNFTKAPINLKSGTTVLSVGSKSYLLVSDISQLKPTTYKNATTKEVNENSLTAPVDVVAADGGDSFDLPAGTRLEITNQVFGSKPQLLYAKTMTPITGGTSRYLSLVSDQDIANSRLALEHKILQDIQASLAQKQEVLPEKFYTIQDLQFTTDKPSGAQSPKFTATLRAKVTGLAFKPLDLQQLLSERIGQTLSSDKTLKTNLPALNYQIKTIDFNNQLAVLDVHFEGSAVYNVDTGDIAGQLVGKTKDQVNEILRSKAAIDHIEITLAPVWQRNFPWFISKISVQMGNSESQGSQ